MPRFLYTAWFRDTDVAEDEQDYEWPACFTVDAEDEARALAWGDHLAKAFSARRGHEHYLFSHVETADEPSLPLVHDGEEASDETIGW